MTSGEKAVFQIAVHPVLSLDRTLKGILPPSLGLDETKIEAVAQEVILGEVHIFGLRNCQRAVGRYKFRAVNFARGDPS